MPKIKHLSLEKLSMLNGVNSPPSPRSAELNIEATTKPILGGAGFLKVPQTRGI
ncbi:MAG: hypothetical protein ACRC8A_04290 [Microcoleaceae cyanobacterium]